MAEAQEILNFSGLQLLMQVRGGRQVELQVVGNDKAELTEVRLEAEVSGQPLLTATAGPTRKPYPMAVGRLVLGLSAALPARGGYLLATLHVRHWRQEMEDRAVALRYLGDGHFEPLINTLHQPIQEAGDFPAPVALPQLHQPGDPQLARLLERIGEQGVMRDLTWLADDARNGRLTASEGEAATVTYLSEQFRAAGLEPWTAAGLQDFSHSFTVPKRAARRLDPGVNSDLTATNVVGYLPGTQQPDCYLIVSGHLDHLGRDSSGAIYNGADDAAGVAAMLEIARALQSADLRPAYSLVFVAFSGREVGLLGSNAFSHLLDQQGLLPGALGCYNLEVLGARNGTQPNIWDEAEESTHSLAAAAVTAAEELGLHYNRINARDPGSDAYSLLSAGVPAISLDWDFTPSNHPYYHTIYDKAENVNPPALTTATKYIAATIWLFLLRAAA